ncbi:MAG: bifunctional hydroxymethylpyrimidine kinase/phosphomethylpyrimidine kinase [Alphaproteobacteria bacterium]
MRGRVLIVAGSDSGGGAGIQADIKTVTALGGYAATAVTALTAQDTLGVHGVHPVPPDFIARQMSLVLADIGADAVKTGMLGDAAVIGAVADVLESDARGIPLVLDPVMVAKGGARLIGEDAVGALIARLLPIAFVVTPNVPEAEALTGRTIKGPDDMEAAGHDLVAKGARAALVKGGHLEGPEVVDVLVETAGVRRFSGARIDSRSTHGTGCTLASAIACSLAQGKPLAAAVGRARAYVRVAIKTAPGFGKGHGPLNHGHTIAPFPGR